MSNKLFINCFFILGAAVLAAFYVPPAQAEPASGTEFSELIALLGDPFTKVDNFFFSQGKSVNSVFHHQFYEVLKYLDAGDRVDARESFEALVGRAEKREYRNLPEFSFELIKGIVRFVPKFVRSDPRQSLSVFPGQFVLDLSELESELQRFEDIFGEVGDCSAVISARQTADNVLGESERLVLDRVTTVSYRLLEPKAARNIVGFIGLFYLGVLGIVVPDLFDSWLAALNGLTGS